MISVAAIGTGAGFLIADGMISLFVALITKSSTTRLLQIQMTSHLNPWLKLDDPAAQAVKGEAEEVWGQQTMGPQRCSSAQSQAKKTWSRIANATRSLPITGGWVRPYLAAIDEIISNAADQGDIWALSMVAT